MVSGTQNIYVNVEVNGNMDVLVDKIVDIQAHYSTLSKGSVFWYRDSKKVYGGIVLDYQPSGYFLISISEKCDEIPQTAADVLRKDFYTVAWFSEIDLLPNRRIHVVGHVKIDEDFNGRAGFFCSQKGLIIKNCGQRDTWQHTFQAYTIHNAKMQSLLHPGQLSKMHGM